MMREEVGLTPGEAEVLELLYKGNTRPQIGEILNLSVRTVDKRIETVCLKTGLNTQYKVVAKVKDFVFKVSDKREWHHFYERCLLITDPCISPCLYLPKAPNKVFILIKEGRSNKEIASLLGIEKRTVEAHAHFLCRRLKVSSRIALVACRVKVEPKQNKCIFKNFIAPIGKRGFINLIKFPHIHN